MRRLAAVGSTALRAASLLTVLLVGPTQAMAGDTIRINGSGTGLEMVKPLIKAYLKANPGASFEVEKPLGSAGAIKALGVGAIDIAISSRPIRPEDSNQGLKFSPYGKTPLAIVTGKNIPLNNITTKGLEDIYSGRTRKWPNQESIRIVLRPLEDIDTKILRGLPAGMNEAVTQAQNRRGMLTAVTDPESNQAVASLAGSLGATGLAGIMVEKTSLSILSLDGVAPTTASLAEGRYPLVKELNFVTKVQPSAAAQKFLDFAYSGQGRAIVESIGVLTIKAGK